MILCFIWIVFIYIYFINIWLIVYLNLITHLFFQNLLLISCRMIWNVWPLWIMFCFISICIVLRINHWYLLFNSVLHTFPKLVPWGNVILSKVCNLLSSLLPSAILLISPVYTLCASLLNLCYDFDIISLSNKQSL